MENKEKYTDETESRIIEIPCVNDRVLRDESDDNDKVIINDRPIDAENAVPPKAWENQKKAYDDAWKQNKNQVIDNDL